jgi:hypothetical protein
MSRWFVVRKEAICARTAAQNITQQRFHCSRLSMLRPCRGAALFEVAAQILPRAFFFL